MKNKPRDAVGLTWYGHQFCSKDFTLATDRKNYLPSIGRKGRVPVGWKRTCKTRLGPSYETLHEMVRKRKMATRNQRENLQQTIRKQTCKQNKLKN